MTISRDGRTAIIVAGSAADTNTMVKAADPLAAPLQGLSTSGVSVTLSGDSALWANFNNANCSAMLRSEMLSWPVTMIILVIAFGSLVAAGLPLLLTTVGFVVAAGSLVMLTHAFPADPVRPLLGDQPQDDPDHPQDPSLSTNSARCAAAGPLVTALCSDRPRAVPPSG